MGTWKALIIFLAVGCAGCNPNGTRRPDVPLCTPISDGGYFECTDSRGDFREPEVNIIGTTLDGYGVIEKYVDDLEIENRKLRKACKQ